MTVGVVTKPLPLRRKDPEKQAEEGVRALKEQVDTLITIPNERLLQIADRNTSTLVVWRSTISSARGWWASPT